MKRRRKLVLNQQAELKKEWDLLESRIKAVNSKSDSSKLEASTLIHESVYKIWALLYMYMVTSQLLSGTILVDGSQALLINGVKSYCRYNTIDAHYENTTDTQESSFPQLFSQHTSKLKIRKINMDKTEKLAIGSNTVNIHVIFSIRIDDSKLPPEVGPSTVQFSSSKKTQIFLSKSSIELANKTLKDPKNVVLGDPLAHIRQLQSKFHQRSTYSLAWFYSVFTQDITVQPYLVHTLVNSITKNNTSCILGSKITSLVSNAVLEENGMLKKEELKQLVPDTTENKTQVTSDILEILKLFEDKEELQIIGNTDKSPYLRSIATTTIKGLKNSNEEMIKKIWTKFIKV